MTAIFKDHASDYAALGLRVFPVGGETGKKPLIRNWRKVGPGAVAALAQKFPDANLGFADGGRGGITRIDVDDPALLNAAVDRFGETPVKVCTPSGGFHLLYRANGERRTLGLDGQKIDVLGAGGYGVAPPSISPKGGRYAFIEGGLDAFSALPPIAARALPPKCYGIHTQTEKTGQGTRTKRLFAELRKIAFECETVDELEFRGQGFNQAYCDPPLSGSEVTAQTRGVWKLKAEGRLIVPGSGGVVIGRAEGAELYAYPPALALLHFLKTHHGPGHVFAIDPLGIAKVGGLPMSKNTIREARDFLIQRGFVECVHRGTGRGNPHRFTFKKGSKI